MHSLLWGPLLLSLGGFSTEIFHLDEFLHVFWRESAPLNLLLQQLRSKWGKLTSGEGSRGREVVSIVPMEEAGDGLLDFSTQRKVTGLQHVESLHAKINPDIISPNTAKETIIVSHKNNPR